MFLPSLLSLIVVSFFVDPHAFAQSEAQSSPWKEKLSAWIKETREAPIATRMKSVSEFFLGTPYVGDPLGEGHGGRYDQDPTYRFDGFDCTTFVETVLALSGASSFENFETRMDGIRYDGGRVDFTARNHFPSLDWIPNVAQAGFASDIVTETAAGTGANVLIARALIDKPRWYSFKKESDLKLHEDLSPEARVERVREWRNEGKLFSPVEATLNYIPFTEFFAANQPNEDLVSRIPTGSVVNIVRPNWDLTNIIGTHMNVSHQMLFLRDSEGHPFLRHASSSQKKVVDQEFFSVMRSYLGHATARGIHIMQVLAPATP